MMKTIAVLLVLAQLLGLGYWHYNDQQNNRVGLTPYEVSDPKIPEGMDGFKMMVISDYHNAGYPEQICELIWESEPDCVIFLGDMVQLPYTNPQTDMAYLLYILDEVADRISTYFISGNHETGTASYYSLYRTMEDHGAVFMDDRQTQLWKNDAYVQLIGLRDPATDPLRERDLNRMCDTVEQLAAARPDAYRIVLCHRSTAYPALKDEPVDLILAGHLHGGLVRLPVLGGVFGKDGDDFFPKYDAGMFQETDVTMIVSRGCDKNPQKVRVNNPPELLLVTLRHGE